MSTINRLRERYFKHAKVPGLDNVVLIVCRHKFKDNDKLFDYACFITPIQRRAITIKRQWLQENFPKSKEIAMIDNPNSIHPFNRFEEEDHVEMYKCHFRLTDQTRDD